MKKIAVQFFCLGMAVFLTACGSSVDPGCVKAKTDDISVFASAQNTSSDDITLIVFAAASMQDALLEIGENYSKNYPHVMLTFNFDSSGTLKTQIEEGADCDIFISAGQKQMDELEVSTGFDEDRGNLSFVQEKTRFDLLENKVVLAVPDGNPKDIHSFDDLQAGLKNGDIFLAVGNSDVPVGQYAQKIFDFFGLDEGTLSARGILTYGSNVKEVTTQISEGTVDCGIIYGTDACSAGLTVVDTASEELCGRVIYPVAILNNSKHPDEAQIFLDYLRTRDAGTVLESAGFSPLR